MQSVRSNLLVVHGSLSGLSWEMSDADIVAGLERKRDLEGKCKGKEKVGEREKIGKEIKDRNRAGKKGEKIIEP